MTTKEELYARQLYQDLQQRLIRKPFFLLQWLGIQKTPSVTISIEGSGTQWKCFVTKETLQCLISCAHIDRHDTNYKGPEYFMQFKREGKNTADGRTFKKLQAIEAIKAFLQNKTMEELYLQFSFIDEEKRQLEKLRISILETSVRAPELPQGEIITDYFSTSSLWFLNGKSTCRIYYHGYDPTPRYIFYWDDHIVFETSGSNVQRLGILVFRWVVDRELPSILKQEFYEIILSPYATEYEKVRQAGKIE